MMGGLMPLGLICVDPGYDTGMSLIEVSAEWNKPKVVRHDTINYQKSGSGAKDFYDKLQEYYDFCRMAQGYAQTDVVLEKFVKRPGVVQPELTAMKVMGVLDCWWAGRANRFHSKFHEQVPVQGKHMVTNQVLLATDTWLPGRANRHINDATRHGISYLVSKAHVGTCRAAFGPPEED